MDLRGGRKKGLGIVRILCAAFYALETELSFLFSARLACFFGEAFVKTAACAKDSATFLLPSFSPFHFAEGDVVASYHLSSPFSVTFLPGEIAIGYGILSVEGWRIPREREEVKAFLFPHMLMHTCHAAGIAQRDGRTD